MLHSLMHSESVETSDLGKPSMRISRKSANRNASQGSKKNGNPDRWSVNRLERIGRNVSVVGTIVVGTEEMTVVETVVQTVVETVVETVVVAVVDPQQRRD